MLGDNETSLKGCEHWSMLTRLPARPASADAEYFRMRTAQEQRAALQSRDLRVRRVHLEMALRYRALLGQAGMRCGAELRLVS